MWLPCDIQFMEGMQLKYNKAAEEAGVHIISACGYDSIPADMGIRYMMRNFKGKGLQCAYRGLRVFPQIFWRYMYADIFTIPKVINAKNND